MDIETQKKNFIKLLQSSFNAHRVVEYGNAYFQDKELGDNEICIKESTLTEYSLGGRSFWEIICPELQDAGILKTYEDPINKKFSDYKERSQFKFFEEEKDKILKIYPQPDDAKKIIESIDADKDQEKEYFFHLYPHYFTVDKDLLFSDTIISKGKNEYYVVRKGDTFYYENEELKLSLEDHYVQAFAVLHEIVPLGGFCTYKNYKKRFQQEYKKTFKSINKDFNSWAQSNLTEKGKGILRQVPNEKLVETRPKKGFEYNNKKK
jgi:hypothetical protein